VSAASVSCSLSSIALALGLALAGCRVPREVHEPLELPAQSVAAATIDLSVPEVVRDPPGATGLPLPAGFGEAAARRLAPLARGNGPALDVSVTSARADAREVLDARGEMTRVSVELELEVRIHDGPVLRRATTGSRSDIVRDEASPDEIDFVLLATALNAVERYFASPKTSVALNADIDAYLARHPSAAAAP
jgi:hypothetical protein